MHFTCNLNTFILYSFTMPGRESTVNSANTEIFNSSYASQPGSVTS